MRSRCALFACLLGLSLPETPTYAHHSVGAEFDLSKRITLQGRVTKIEWMNPHVYLYVDVNAADDVVKAYITVYKPHWIRTDEVITYTIVG